MKRAYCVTYTFGASIVVEAKNEKEAEGIVEGMDSGELIYRAKDGFEIQGVEELG